MVDALRRLADSRVVRFVVVGGINTVFGYSVFAALVAAGLPPELALLVGTVLSVAFNFATTGRLVFGSASSRRLPRFCLAYAVVYVLNAAALHALVTAGLSAFLAQALLVPCAAVVTFQLMKLFVFSEKPA